ncbi:MAG: class I mannose-6-phosphate isomerase, partial [Turneriella sp.]|nr:class I mannose-6-phosphate isomerase [Turneriella sp.]
IGEYVLFSDLPQFPVAISVRGQTIPLAEFWRAHYGEKPLPFMLKLISTHEPLSVQNHPSDADVERLGLPGRGKAEAWVILDAEKEARIYLGLKEEYSVEILHRLSELPDPLAPFQKFVPKLGDVVLLSPGLIHSTTGRILFYEIQLVSDHTFRIYDFGRGRNLDIGAAISCLNNTRPEIRRFSEELNSAFFRVSFHRKAREIRLSAQNGAVLTWFGGRVKLSCAGDCVEANWGSAFFVAQSHGQKLQLEELGEGPSNLPMIDMLFEAHL